MGIYTSNTHYSLGGGVDYASQIPADESYNAVTGYAVAMLEAHENDMAIFNASIMGDFQEVAAMNEGAYGVINEGAKEVVDKIIAMFKKLLAKIKGIFQAFLTKITKVFKSNKTLFNDYKNRIAKCPNWSKFKMKKVRIPKNEQVETTIDDLFTYGIAKQDVQYSTLGRDMMGLEFEKINKGDYDSDDFNTAIMKSRLNDSIASKIDGDLKNMESEYMDAIFDEEEDKTDEGDWSLATINGGYVGQILEQGTKWQDKVDKQNTKLTKCISKIINELEKIKSEAAKGYLDKSADAKVTTKSISVTSDGNDGYDVSQSDNAGQLYSYSTNIGRSSSKPTQNAYGTVKKKNEIEYYMKKISALQTIASHEQTIITKYTATYTNVVKFAVSQARRIWTSAAAYAASGAKNESFELYNAIGEASAYDVISDMEIVC